MKLIRDVFCIILLVLLPDWILDVTGLYRSMYVMIVEGQEGE